MANIISLFKLIFYKNTHSSKLQTALYNAINSMKDNIRSKKKRLISKKKENSLFATRDQKYNEIRGKKIASGIIEKSPEDAKELHKVNVISSIVKYSSQEK